MRAKLQQIRLVPSVQGKGATLATLASSYRVHRAGMTEADNAMMALLVGAQFASSSLALSAGSNVLLSSMFPSVPHIERFQYRPERAQRELGASEEHLARIAIPYALSVHEDFVGQVKADFEKWNVPVSLNGRRWNAETMHEILFESVTTHPNVDLTEFDLLRRIRNSLIHSGGTVDNYLEEGVDRLSPQGSSHWQEVTGRHPAEIVETGRVVLTAGEIMLAFSVVRYLSKVAHQGMLDTLPRSFWLQDFVDGFISEYRSHIKKRLLLRRKMEAWSNRYYEDFHFAWNELRDGAIDAGLPTVQLRKRKE